MSRFDYVKYDKDAETIQANFKSVFTGLEQMIDKSTGAPRYKALALTKLEECYMYIGKAIRDDQIERNGEAESQEERSNS